MSGWGSITGAVTIDIDRGRPAGLWLVIHIPFYWRNAGGEPNPTNVKSSKDFSHVTIT